MLQDSFIAYKESKLFFAHAPNITVLQKGGRIPLIKGDACFAAATSIIASVEVICSSAGTGSLQVSNGSK